jgi:hypothetical protein
MATEEKKAQADVKADVKVEPEKTAPPEESVDNTKTPKEAKETPAETETEKPKEEPKAVVPAKSGGSKTGLIIALVVIFLVIILGVGGFLAWKYLIKGKLTKKTTPTSETATTSNTTAAKTKLQQLEEYLKYPKSAITQTDHNTSYGALTNLTMASDDSIDTIHKYYLDLAQKNGWVTGAETTSAADGSNSVEITAKGFRFDVSAIKGDDGKSKVEVTIYSDNIEAVDPVNSAVTATSASTTSTSNTATSTSTTKATITDNYVIADSDTRVISKSELTGLTPWQLKVARNEIYARHGREFVHKDLQCYFATKSWYSANAAFTESDLGATENKNVATIQAYESEISSPLASKDSGC